MWVLIEGGKDSRFVRGVLRPILQRAYDFVETWEYAERPPEKVVDFLKSMSAMKADYLFLGDFDTSPCVTERKEHLLRSYKPMLDAGRIIVVRAEIESWYLAGVDDKNCQGFGIPVIPHTDGVTKEQFEKLMPTKFKSVVDFMDEIVNRFCIDAAIRKNRSFGYLMDLLEARSKEA